MRRELRAKGRGQRPKAAWIALAPALLLVAAGCNGKGEQALRAETTPKPVPVTVAKAERRAVERTVEVVGTIKGWEDVTVGAKKTGRVVKVLHDMGDQVKPGEPLVELETVDARLSVQQAEKRLAADLAKLGLAKLPGRDKEFEVEKVPAVVKDMVALERARNNLERQRNLVRTRAGTMQDMQNYENDLKAAEATLQDGILAAQANLAAARASQVALDVAHQALVDTVIRAPVPSTTPRGTTRPIVFAVGKRSVSEGQYLREGDAVMSLVVNDPLRLWMNVPERYAAEVREGQAVRLRVPAYPGRAFEGKVARINPTVDASTRTFQVEATVPNDDGALRPGGFAKASILTRAESDAVTVPLEAVVRFAGVTKVFVVLPKNLAREVPVETGLEDPDGRWVEVVGRVSPGADVITTGQLQLADGASVVVKDAAPEEKAAPATATATATADNRRPDR
jgi:RND family efflux transporter MFP subunit